MNETVIRTHDVFKARVHYLIRQKLAYAKYIARKTQSRSCYLPHQSTAECARRVNQARRAQEKRDRKLQALIAEMSQPLWTIPEAVVEAIHEEERRR